MGIPARRISIFSHEIHLSEPFKDRVPVKFKVIERLTRCYPFPQKDYSLVRNMFTSVKHEN